MKRITTLFLAAVVIFAAGCSKQNEADLMNQAIKLSEKKKYDEAMKLYQQVAVDFPESKSAPMALYAVGLIQLNDLKVPEDAIKTFNGVAEKYPDSEYGHKCLFMAGFVYANNLRQYSKAKESYKTYLSKYRDSSMAATAQFELEHLGQSAEQVLEAVQDTTKSTKPKEFVHP